MHPPPYSHLAKGTLLIASPEIDSGIYFRSVVLICEHNAGGSFGVLINKPVMMELPEEILNMKEINNPNVEMRAGGLIQPNQMMLLHSCEEIPDQTLKVCNGVCLGGDLQFLQESINNPHGPSLRLCFGYCGWGPGALEREFLSGAWYLHPASARHIFDIPADRLWQSLLREMGGKYATLSMIPEDLSLN
jgi:putative transcriptional regulator